MKRFWLPLAMLVALTTLLAGSASAIELKYTGKAYSPDFGSYYVGPYSFQMDGHDVAGICNDFDGRITSGQSWTVTRHTLDNAGLVGSRYYGQTIGGNYIDQDDYRAAAYLANQMLALHNGWNSITTAQRELLTRLQYAIWTIFDADNPPNNVGTTADINAITALRSQAYAANYSGGGWAVFTPVQWSSTIRPQEILIRVPEASVVGVMGLNFAALGLLGYAFRRRMN